MNKDELIFYWLRGYQIFKNLFRGAKIKIHTSYIRISKTIFSDDIIIWWISPGFMMYLSTPHIDEGIVTLFILWNTHFVTLNKFVFLFSAQKKINSFLPMQFIFWRMPFDVIYSFIGISIEIISTAFFWACLRDFCWKSLLTFHILFCKFPTTGLSLSYHLK